MPEVKVKFHRKAIAAAPDHTQTIIVDVCGLCGALVGLKATHLAWHDDTNMYEPSREVFYAQTPNHHVEDLDG